MRRVLWIALALGVLLAAPATWASITVPIGHVPPKADGCTAALPKDDAGPASHEVAIDTDPSNVKLDGTILVSPPSFRFRDGIVVDGGWVYDCTLTIRNRHETRTTLQLQTMGVVGTRAKNAGYEFVDESDKRYDSTAGPWITPAVHEVTMDPREVARVPFRIAVPQAPPAGSAIGSINVVSRTDANAGDAVVGVESQVASVVLIPTSGGPAELHLRHVDAPTLRIDRAAWPFTADLDNDGTLYAESSGRVRVRSIFGNEVASLAIPASTVLPGGREPIAVTWKRVPWFGIYRWDARVASKQDAIGQTSIARANGWIIALPPWWALAVFAAIVLALLVWWLRRRAAAWDDDEDDDLGDIYSAFDFDLAERQLREPPSN